MHFGEASPRFSSLRLIYARPFKNHNTIFHWIYSTNEEDPPTVTACLTDTILNRKKAIRWRTNCTSLRFRSRYSTEPVPTTSTGNVTSPRHLVIESWNTMDFKSGTKGPLSSGRSILSNSSKLLDTGVYADVHFVFKEPGLCHHVPAGQVQRSSHQGRGHRRRRSSRVCSSHVEVRFDLYYPY